MNIIVSNASSQAIYEQIYNQVKLAIVSSEINTGDLLPSIRNLAKDLRISVITTKRAYDELEKDGYIYSVAGKGFYVAEKNLDFMREQYLTEIEEHMRKILSIAPMCNITSEELIEMLLLLSKEG